MFKDLFNHASLRKAERLLRQHWLVALCVAAFVGIIWAGAPAWAAPVTQGGTVPNPTATSEGNPLATATPQPDDDDDGGDTGVATNTPIPIDPNAPNIVFPLEPGTTPASGLTAQVTVDGLNVREGPGTNFNSLGNIPVNTQVSVLSRNEDGAWWYVCCIPGTQTPGWVSAQLLAPNFDAGQANTLIPVFSADNTEPVATNTPQPESTTPAMPQAELPLTVEFQIDPYFVWQGVTATLTITVNNPNTVDAVNVLLSDEIPSVLTLISAEADAGGRVETVSAATGNPLLLFRWEVIPADTAATVTIVTLVSPELRDGDVIDNLVATRAANVPYSTDAFTIGMPPVVPPDFQ